MTLIPPIPILVISVLIRLTKQTVDKIVIRAEVFGIEEPSPVMYLKEFELDIQ